MAPRRTDDSGAEGGPLPWSAAADAGTPRGFGPALRVQADTSARTWLLRVLIPTAVLVRGVMGQIDRGLGLLHGATERPRGVGALAQGAGDARTALASWDAASTDLQPDFIRASGTALVQVHGVLGLVSAVVVPTLILFVALGCFSTFESRLEAPAPEPSGPRPLDAMAAAVAGVDARLQAARFRRALGVAMYAVPVVVAAGLVQALAQVALTVVEGRWFDVAAVVLRGTRLVGALVTVLILLVIAAALLALIRDHRHHVAALLWTVWTLRVQVLVVGAFAVLCLAGPPAEQVADAIRTWRSHPVSLVWGLTTLLLLSAVVAVIGARLIEISEVPARGRSKVRHLVVAGVVLGGAGGALWAAGATGPSIAILGCLLLALAGMSEVIPARTGPLPPARDLAGAVGALAALTAAPPLVFSVVAMRAAVPGAIGAGILPFTAVGIAVALVAGVVVVHAGAAALLGRALGPDGADPVTDDRRRLGRVGRAVVGVAGVALVAVHVAVVVDPWASGRHLGAFALTSLVLAEVGLVVGLLCVLGWRDAPVSLLDLLDLRRWPVVGLLVVWLVVAGAVDRGSIHDVRLTDRTGDGARLDLAVHTEAWMAQQLDATSEGGAPADGTLRPAVPLVLVGSSGGGVRAAAWTAIVADCAFGDGGSASCPDDLPDVDARWRSLYAMSGASGGTVGLASVLAEHLALPGRGDSDQRWVSQRLGTDLLSPAVGWQLFVEGPATVLQLRPGMDRAEVLERTWATRWEPVERDCLGDEPVTPGDLGFLSLWADGGTTCGEVVPLLFANGTSLTDGCRFNVSALDSAPPFQPDLQARCRAVGGGAAGRGRTFTVTRDLVDSLCPHEDLPLASAAFLSARFPFVSPSGRVRGPARRGASCDGWPDGSEALAFVADGGYRDNTGASTLMELWDQLAPAVARHNDDPEAPCVVPVYVDINNGYDAPSAPMAERGLSELAAPAAGALSVFGARDADGRQAAAAAFGSAEVPGGLRVVAAGDRGMSEGDPVGRYIQFRMHAHPGVQAPLGWSLSTEAAEDLERQLALRDNADRMRALHDILTPGALTCEPAS